MLPSPTATETEKEFKNAVSSKNLSAALDIVLAGFDVNSFDQLLIKSCMEQNNSKILKNLLDNKDINPKIFYPTKGLPLTNAVGRRQSRILSQVIGCENIRKQVPLKEWAIILLVVHPEKDKQNLAKMVFSDLMKHSQLEEVVWLANQKFPKFKFLKNFFENLSEKEQETAKNYLISQHKNSLSNKEWLNALEYVIESPYIKIHMERFMIANSVEETASLKEKPGPSKM